MKKTNKSIAYKILISVILALSISLNTMAASFYSEDGQIFLKSNQPEKPDEGEINEEFEDWSDIEFTIEASETEISSVFNLELVSENQNFRFWYDTAGADIYVLDKRSGHIWSNTVNDDYYNHPDASAAMRSLLLQTTVADADGAGAVVELCDAKGDELDFKLTPKYTETGMTLKVELIKFSVSFDISFILNEEGLEIAIPSKSINQENGNRLVSITLMPYFGAARTDLEGYLLIPDGSGALIEFNNMETEQERVYSYSLYGQSEQDINKLMNRDDQDIKNMMLPIFGVKNHKNGFLAAVTNGAENAYLNIVPYGYQCPKLARCYYTFMYHYTEKLTINGKVIEQIMPNQELSDRSVQYFLLDEKSDYSDMAVVYRNHLEENGILKNKIENNLGEISLDIFMGVKKKGMFFESFVDMTDFDAVKDIVTDLKKSGVNNLEISLQGWNDGGYTNYPTPQKTASKLGGKREFKKLLKWLKDNNVKTYIYNDFFTAYPESKNVNLRKDVIRDYVSNVHMNLTGTTIVMNNYLTLNKYLTSAKKSGIYDNSGFSLARAGQWLWNSFENGNESTRNQTVNAIEESLKSCVDDNIPLQLYGGNQYVLPYADSLREIPDTASNYYYETASVPFFQLVVNGYFKYTSIAGNMSYDTNYQKLKWIETGSLPYYVITDKNSMELIETEYDRLFSSEYEIWGVSVKSVSKEFATRLKDIAGAQMVEHTIISDDVVSVKYSNGVVIYINYSQKDTKIGELLVKSMDYSLVKVQKVG